MERRKLKKHISPERKCYVRAKGCIGVSFVRQQLSVDPLSGELIKSHRSKGVHAAGQLLAAQNGYKNNCVIAEKNE